MSNCRSKNTKLLTPSDDITQKRMGIRNISRPISNPRLMIDSTRKDQNSVTWGVSTTLANSRVIVKAYNEFIMTARPRRLTTISTKAWCRCALINESELFDLSAWLANSSVSVRTGRKRSEIFPRSRFDSAERMLGMLGRGTGFTEARSCVAKADPRKRA